MTRTGPRRPTVHVVRAMLLLLVLLLPGLSSAQSAAPFTRMGFGARGIALGNAGVADGFGSGSPYYNPALAPMTSRQTLGGTVAVLSMDRRLEFLQFATPLAPRAGVAAGLIHAGVSQIDGRDNSGYHTDSYATDEYAFFLAFGIRLSEEISIGTNVQVYRSDHFEELDPVIGLGIDLGAHWRASKHLQVGLAIDDLLARYSWDTSPLYGQQGRTNTDVFPKRLRLGAAYALEKAGVELFAEAAASMRTADERRPIVDTFKGRPFESVESEEQTLYNLRFRMGAAYRIAAPIALRLGVDRLGAEPVGQTMPTAGFMLSHSLGRLDLQADYAVAFVPYAGSAMHFMALKVFL